MISFEFLITSLIVVLIPGTGVIYTLSIGLTRGFSSSVTAALGCTFGIVPAMLSSIAGLAAVFHTSAIAFQVIKYLGVIYLLYLAWNMWHQAEGITLHEAGSQESGATILLKGLLINILNPKLTLFFLAFLPQFVESQNMSAALSMLWLGGVFMLMTFVVFVLYGSLAHLLRGYLTSAIAGRWLQRSFAATFAALGVKLALTER